MLRAGRLRASWPTLSVSEQTLRTWRWQDERDRGERDDTLPSDEREDGEGTGIAIHATYLLAASQSIPTLPSARSSRSITSCKEVPDLRVIVLRAARLEVRDRGPEVPGRQSLGFDLTAHPDRLIDVATRTVRIVIAGAG